MRQVLARESPKSYELSLPPQKPNKSRSKSWLARAPQSHEASPGSWKPEAPQTSATTHQGPKQRPGRRPRRPNVWPFWRGAQKRKTPPNVRNGAPDVQNDAPTSKTTPRTTPHTSKNLTPQEGPVKTTPQTPEAMLPPSEISKSDVPSVHNDTP